MGVHAFGDAKMYLMEGERIESALDLNEGLVDGPMGDSPSILLTDRRMILLNANGRRRTLSFASLRDIHAVQITVDGRGAGSFVWAALAIVVAVLLWAVLDHPVGSVAAGIAVGLMGVYLIVDRLTEPRRSLFIIKVGSSDFQCALTGARAAADAQSFANRLFQLREGERRASPSPPAGRLSEPERELPTLL